MPSSLLRPALWACSALLALSGCATRPASLATSATAEEARILEDRLIVVAVRNEAAPLGSAGSTERGYSAAGTYTVSSAARRAINELSRDYRLRKRSEWPIDVLAVHCAVFEIEAGSDRAELLTRLASDPRVALAQPLQSFATLTGAVPHSYTELQSGLEKMAVPEAHRLSTGRGVRVAVIDTGIDTAHPNLRGRVESEHNFVDDNARVFRSDRHGTAVGGVIAATQNGSAGMVGVAPDARLLAMKACWQLQPGHDAARCNSFTLAQALSRAIELRPQIINLSLTGPEDPLLRALIERAVKSGIVVVGPGAGGLASGFPGALPSVLNVVRSEALEAANGALRAPGDEVLTLTPGGGYDFASGDSMAAAAVSGVSALVLARQHPMQAGRLRELLDQSTVTHDANGTAQRMINACVAVAANMPGASCAGGARH